MKYGILFAIVSLLLVYVALTQGGWQVVLLWPAASFGIVAAGYLHLGPRVFGKSQSGRLSFIAQLVLFPYLFYLWSVWHLLRIIKREAAFDQLVDQLYIGRRLLSRELPCDIVHVVDLTCEFNEPRELRSLSYHSFQILDGAAPSPDQLQKWVDQVAGLTGNVYVHCAEGHGRTGLFAAALLLRSGRCDTPEEAISFVKSKRPLVRLGRQQMEVLRALHESG